MTNQELNKLKYPIGQFIVPEEISKNHIIGWISSIESLPYSLISLTKNLSDKELNYKYRPNGWTIKQVIHHCSDSHINSLLRFKLALTEDVPTIKPYYEDRFAHLIDYTKPIDTSISILVGVHEKLGVLLRHLNEEELKRQYIHPDHNKTFTISETIGIYSWHSNHHLEHVKQALKFKEEFA